MPPSHAGIVPPALPAFSAPIGVSVVPSFARSLAESSAAAGAASAAPATSAAQVFLVINMVLLLFSSSWRALERIAHAERIEIAVLERVGAGAPACGLPRGDAAAGRRRIGAAELLP